MNPTTLAFLFGIVIGGFGATLLIGLLFLDRKPDQVNNVQNMTICWDRSLIDQLKISKPPVWGAERPVPLTQVQD
jgi:hypothetical protein